MTRKQVQVLLEEALRQGHILDVRRTKLDPSYIRCRIIAAGQRLVLVRWEEGFAWDGYALLRLRDIDGLYRADDTAFYQDMFRAAGLYDQGDNFPADLPLDDWAQALRWLQSFGQLVSIECEQPAEEFLGDRYLLGRLLDVKKSTTLLQPLGREGQWLPAARLRHKDITCVRLGSRYIAAHEEAVRGAAQR